MRLTTVISAPFNVTRNTRYATSFWRKMPCARVFRWVKATFFPANAEHPQIICQRQNSLYYGSATIK